MRVRSPKKDHKRFIKLAPAASKFKRKGCVTLAITENGGKPRMAQLVDMLKSSTNFQSLPAEKQEIFFRLADAFDDNDFAMHLSPTELTVKLQIGNRDLWQQFLQMDTVLAYIKQQMSFNAQVAHRKAFNSLQKEASQGDTQAAKQINELAGIYANTNNNKVIVLHQIARPKNTPPTEVPNVDK